MRYRVIVELEDGAWLADVPQVPGAHTWAADLPRLEQHVREVVVLMAGPTARGEAPDLEWTFETGDADFDRRATELCAQRAKVDVPDHRTRAIAAELGAHGWAVRDIGWLLGVSPRRVGRWVPKAARGVAGAAH